ncbi:MAG: hypothetical protein V3T31_05100 [candidate division Zixibacteria bacterium]
MQGKKLFYNLSLEDLVNRQLSQINMYPYFPANPTLKNPFGASPYARQNPCIAFQIIPLRMAAIGLHSADMYCDDNKSRSI